MRQVDFPQLVTIHLTGAKNGASIRIDTYPVLSAMHLQSIMAIHVGRTALISIRHEIPADASHIFEVNRRAFGQTAEAALVNALRDGGFVTISLVAVDEGEIVGHILFSRLPIITATGVVEAVSLAPMAVLPDHQRRGIGSALVRAGLEECRAAGHRIAVVLGHPKFYQGFGFDPQLAERLISPFGSGEAWLALELVTGALAGVEGRVEYPAPFLALE